jgi:hypothetical protein
LGADESETYLRSVRANYGLASIRSYLLLLIVALLGPMLVLAGVLAWHYGSAGRRTIGAERVHVANNLAGLIDRQIGTTPGVIDVVSRDGVEIKNSFQRSTLAGWSVGVAVPASVVNAPL